MSGDRRCVIVGCRSVGEHDRDCQGGKCRGCMPRLVEDGLVCNPDRTRLAAWLAELPRLHAELEADPDPVDRHEWTVRQWRWIPTSDPSRRPMWAWVREPGADHLATILPMGITRTSHQSRVSGSREKPVPADLDRLDLIDDARPASRALFARAVLGDDPDQIGTLSAATILEDEVRDLRKALWPDHHLPERTVPELASWLANRLSDACDRYLDVDRLAASLSELRQSLRGKLGLTDAPRELCKGVACRACDRKALYREGGGYVTCGHCGQHYNEREYTAWIGLLAGQARRMAA